MKENNEHSRRPARGVAVGALAFAGALAAISAPVFAADLGGYKDDEAQGPGWIVTVGALPGFAPEYMGADSYRFNVIPLFSVRRPGEKAEPIFPDDMLDYALIDTGRFKFGPAGNLKSGRGSADRAEFRYIENYDWAVQAGVFGEAWLVPETFRLRAELLWGFHSGDGLTANLAADWVQHFGGATLSVGPRMVVMSDSTAQFEFGVSPEQALLNRYVAPYHASGGVESVGVAANLTYPLTPQTSFMAFGRYDGLMGSAADSTITERFGSDSQFTVGVGLTYSFNYQ
jgi:outer membrane protein